MSDTCNTTMRMSMVGATGKQPFKNGRSREVVLALDRPCSVQQLVLPREYHNVVVEKIEFDHASILHDEVPAEVFSGLHAFRDTAVSSVTVTMRRTATPPESYFLRVVRKGASVRTRLAAWCAGATRMEKPRFSLQVVVHDLPRFGGTC